MAATPLLMILALSAATIVGGSLYFRRWRLTPPPIGVFDLGDIAFLLGSVIVLPLVYLVLPTWLLIGLMALGALSALYLTVEPMLGRAWCCWLVVSTVAVAEGWAALWSDPTATLALVNDAVIMVAVIGVANLWVQGGMRARDAAILGGALSVYDLVATSMLPLMGDLMVRVQTLPFGPIVSWPGDASGPGALIGMGDLLLATMFPLVMRKAYGQPASYLALAVSGASIVAPSAFTVLAPADLFPVMIVLGPAMVLQYTWWSWRAGAERTTWQYLQAEPLGGADQADHQGAVRLVGAVTH